MREDAVFEKELQRLLLQDEIKAERLVRIFIWSCFLFGAILVYKYETYWYGWGIGSLTILLYYIGKKFFPYTFAQRLLNCSILQLYILQFIYQMHGLYEMHFTFFAITTMLIIYKDIWAMIISGIIPIVQHILLFTLQMKYNYDLREYFINIENLTIEILFYHLFIAFAHLIVVGTFCVVLKKNMIDNFKDKINLLETEAIKELNKEILQQNEEILQQNEEIEQQKEELKQTLHITEIQKAQIQQKNQDMLDSINYAWRIQNTIIPTESELQKYFDCFVLFQPRDIVSGDFYWFADKGEMKIFALADCTGHGVPGAFMTIIGNNILNQIIHDYEIHEPDQILTLSAALLQKKFLNTENGIRDSMEIAVITFTNLGAEKVQVSFAGARIPLYYVQNGQFYEIQGNRESLREVSTEDFSYKKHELVVDSSTIFYLCTDGFQDQIGEYSNKKFMTKNFKKLLLEISNLPLREQKATLAEKLATWQGNQSQTDDILVVGIRV